MSADWAWPVPLTRVLTTARSTAIAPRLRPSAELHAEPEAEAAEPSADIAPAVSISVLDGTQSVSTQAPPRPSVRPR